MKSAKHLLTIDETWLDFDLIANLTKSIYHYPYKYIDKLKGKILATLFFEPSTRTKLSFHAAMQKLGGGIIDLGNDSSVKKGESVGDTIKTVSQFSDIIVIRTSDTDISNNPAFYECEKPIINAGDGHNEHPTQALIDLYTINQFKQDQENLTIMFTGDLYYSRTVNSLCKLLKHTNCKYKFIFTNEVSFAIKDLDRESKRKKDDPGWVKQFEEVNFSCCFIDEDDIIKHIEEVDVLYMTRPQKERHSVKEVSTNFSLNLNMVYRMKADSIIMHPFPRNDEIPPTIDGNYRAKYFKQIENGLYLRMALLQMLTSK